MHLNHVDGTSNLFSDALSRTHRIDDIEDYDCYNKILCTQFCYAVCNEIPSSQPSFALDATNNSNKQKMIPVAFL